jgi:hypothetical protein
MIRRGIIIMKKGATIKLGIVAFLLIFFTFFSVELAIGSSIYTNPTDFQTAISGLGVPTVLNFEDIDAGTLNNTYLGRNEFDGNFYANEGISFSNPNGYPLYVAPGGLFWNESNSLSIGALPFDSTYDVSPRTEPFNVDDDLIVTFDQPQTAVGFTLVDNGTWYADEYVQFLDSHGEVIAQMGLPKDYISYRAFLGIVSLEIPIFSIKVVEALNDVDDVDYDDFIFVKTNTSPAAYYLEDVSVTAAQAVPEPATLLLFITGLAGIWLIRKRVKNTETCQRSQEY